MIRLGLIGYPVNHSLSPKIQNAALKASGLAGDYSLFPIAPDDKQGLKKLLDRVRSGEIRGLNVTIPHKQNIIEFLDELTPTAKAIGAINAIYLRDDKLIGDNTDAPGFLTDLNKFLGGQKLGSGNHKSAVILGAGGGARAVVYALLNEGWNVTVAARRIEQAQQLANSFANYQLQITSFDLQSLILRQAQGNACYLVVNTTPLGTTPNIDVSPLSENLSLPQHVVIYDLVYNPRETKLIKDAIAKGLKATTGLGMLIEQAALAFELWTNHNPPRDVLWNAVDH
ncbi:MAG TPA: shikimate dehydrogenase [Anaerolineales bacterium]